MVKIVFLLRRKSGMTREQFLERWGVGHAALAKRLGDRLGIKTYVQLHPLAHPIANLIQESRGSLMGDFDGIAEASWESLEDAMNIGQTEADIAAEVLADEAEFVDFERSVMWFGSVHPVIG